MKLEDVFPDDSPFRWDEDISGLVDEGNRYGHFDRWYENLTLDLAHTPTDSIRTVEYSNVLVSMNLANSTPAERNKIIRYWLMDSGCTIHITPCHEDFISYREYTTPLILKGVDKNNKISIHGEGTVLIKTSVNGEIRVTKRCIIQKLKIDYYQLENL